MYVSVPPACNALAGKKRALESLELKSPIGVICLVGAGNQTWVFCRRSKYP